MESQRRVSTMREGEYVDSLVDEYATLLRERLSRDLHNRHDDAGIIKVLEASADRSTSGARELVRLADNYGAFMLRNALAIAVVLGKEDGVRGF
jgi:hypothetical protein